MRKSIRAGLKPCATARFVNDGGAGRQPRRGGPGFDACHGPRRAGLQACPCAIARATWALAACLCLGFAVAAAQSPEPSLEILSPPDQSYVSGPLVLHAGVAPPSTEVARVRFFADGRLVCTVERPPFQCTWDAGPGLKAHRLQAVAALVDGRRLTRAVRTRGVAHAENVQVTSVLVTAVVTDGQQFVRGLRREAFRVLEDGAPQSITHFAAENIPLEMIVAVDASASMTAAMPTLKLAVKKFLDALSPSDQVTLLAFNDDVFVLAGRDADASSRLEAVDRLTAWGGTALYDAFTRAIDLLGRGRGRRALVVFTDGEDRSSRSTIDEVRPQIEETDAAVYVIGQSRGARDLAREQALETLARVSGGRAFFGRKMDRLDEDFRRITEELSNQYLLAYTPGRPARGHTWRRITVELVGARHTVRARQGYRTAAQPEP